MGNPNNISRRSTERTANPDGKPGRKSLIALAAVAAVCSVIAIMRGRVSGIESGDESRPASVATSTVTPPEAQTAATSSQAAALPQVQAEEVPPVETSSAATALTELQKACGKFLSSADRDKSPEAVLEAMTELKEAMKKAEEVTGQEQHTFAHACGISNGLVRKIMGEGAARDDQLAEEVARTIESFCGRQVANEAGNILKKALDTSECDGLPTVRPSESCAEEVLTKFRPIAADALEDALAACSIPSGTKADEASPEQQDCMEEEMRRLHERLKAEFAQCAAKTGELKDECRIRVMRAGQAAAQEHEAASRESCPRDAARQWGLDWDQTLAGPALNVKVVQVVTTHFSVTKGNHLPSVPALETYLEQLGTMLTAGMVGPSSPELLKRLGVADKKALQARYIAEFYASLKTLVGRLSAEEAAAYADIMHRFEVLSVLGGIMVEEE